MATLAGGPSFPYPVKSKYQGLAVVFHVELPPLQQELEVAQQLPVKDAVPRLSVSELPAEEGEWLPMPFGGPLLQGCHYVVVARIYSQCELCLLDWICQVGGLLEGRLGS